MLTSPLEEIRSAIREMRSQEMNILEAANPYSKLLDVLEQMDSLEVQLTRAYKEGGVTAAARVIVKPSQPNCQICGRTILSPTP